jgi:putative glycosyltransferase (TIGR04372 family)
LPDALRRIHKGKRILFIIPWDKGSGPNTATANIFPDVDIWFFKLLMVRLTLFEKKIAMPAPHVADGVLRKIFLRLAPVLAPRAHILDWKEAQVFPIPDELKALYAEDPDLQYWDLGVHCWLQRNVTAPRLRLEEEKRLLISKHLAAARRAAGRGEGSKLCVFHTTSFDVAPLHCRKTSPPDSYVPAFRYLVERGYQVMLTGEQELSPAYRREFAGMAVDADSLGVDKKSYLVFAGTEANFFIGDPGGGNVLPSTNDIPLMVFNAYALGGNVHGACIFPKKAVDQNNRELSLEDIVGLKDVITPPAELKFYENTEEDILEAVKSFVEETEGRAQVDERLFLENIFPDKFDYVASGVRLSKAYARRYCSGLVPANNGFQEKRSVENAR